MKKKISSVFITGASSGVGKALAELYAEKDITLFLCGRNEIRLNDTAEKCREKGATVYTFVFDVTNMQEAEIAIRTADSLKEIELVIANAGVSGGVLGEAEDSPQTRQVFQTNLGGVINTVLPALELMRSRKKGQVALVSSIAGYRGLPSAPAYSASKCAVKAWGEALRGWLRTEGIKVNVICPGFIKTPLTAVNRFPMPFLMSPQKAAKKIKKGIRKNRAIIAFPWPMVFGSWLMSALPSCLALPILRALPRKEGVISDKKEG